MSDKQFVFNGVNGLTGEYATPPLTPGAVAALARGEWISSEHLQAMRRVKQRDEPTYGVAGGIDADDLAQTGWGVVFRFDASPELARALRPLLDLRKAQAASTKGKEHYYRELTADKGYRPPDTRRTFLHRNGALPGRDADPETFPYYLLLVGSPEDVPFEFQYQLDVDYAVGRLWFETEGGRPDYDAFARYAASVVAAETSSPPPSRRAAFFAPQHDGDLATDLGVNQLVRPLLEQLRPELKGWECQEFLREGAGKSQLARLLGGDQTPAFLFTASHGVGFPTGDGLQTPHQGALLCQDSPGPQRWRGAIPPDHYFSADDLAPAARPHGLIAFLFACYGAGTPDHDDFAHVPELRRFSCAAPRPLLARLPQRLLAHPNGGALAVLGHVDRAWSYSFYDSARLSSQVVTYRSALLHLLGGGRLGHALDYFNRSYSSLGCELAEILKEVHDVGYDPADESFSSLWTATNDARNFVLLGDPAVSLPAAVT